ncbi:MAG: hypothetical protein K2W95_31680 [Candidatus Obscuribacterales bacterium]|nr:hypothetical protein [Candidatus Obscuribacterales bacterium]
MDKAAREKASIRKSSKRLSDLIDRIESRRLAEIAASEARLKKALARLDKRAKETLAQLSALQRRCVHRFGKTNKTFGFHDCLDCKVRKVDPAFK